MAGAEENNVGRMNPLLMESIMETVFQYIPTQYLNDCSLVNKLWNREARRARRYRHAVTLGCTKSMKNLLDRFERNPKIWIAECHLKLISLDNPILQKLIPKLAEKLNFLDIQDCTGAEETLHEMIRSLPNLTKLEIGTTKTAYGLYHQKFPIYEKGDRTKEMQFPNIKSLEVLSYNDDKYMRTLLSSIVRACPNLVHLIPYNLYPEDPTLFKNLRLPHLTHLDFNIMQTSAANGKGGMTNKHLECLLAMKLDLKRLVIVNIVSDLKIELLKTFLESQQNLTELELLQKDERNPMADTPLVVSPFPLALPKLTGLIISRAFVKNFGHILTSCPQLKVGGFDFDPWNAKWDRILPKNPLPMHGLSRATFSSIDDKALSKLSHTFKNLSQLKIHNVDDSMLRVIFTEFTQIKVLSLYGAKNSGGRSMTQDGLTGIPTEFIPAGEFSDDVDVSTIRKLPYIGNMKELTQLFLSSHSGISESVFWYGFKDILANLTLISIKGFDEHSNPWSENLIATLEKSFFVAKRSDVDAQIRKGTARNCPVIDGYGDENDEDEEDMLVYIFINKKVYNCSTDENVETDT